MSSKIFTLPGVKAELMFHVKQSAATLHDLFVVAGGRRPDADWLKSAACGKSIYCADKGFTYCRAAGLVPVALYGDRDSAAADAYTEAQDLGVQVYTYPAAKDDTDLQLVLQNLPEGDLIASGIWGGRFDHLYSNIYSLLNCKQQRQCQVLLADDKELLLLLEAGESVKVQLERPVEAVSLLPLSPAVIVDFTGVQWELQQSELKQLYPYAISNLPKDMAQPMYCACHEGSLGLYIKFAN